MTPRNRLLIGQIALDLRLLTREQLQQCVDLQAGQIQPKPIGALLVQNGFLSTDQLARVIEEQERRLQEPLPHSPAAVGTVAFGRLVVERGHTLPEHVNEALRAQQDLADRGLRRRLGELLVEAGHLKAEIVPSVLKIQGKTLMACTFCGSHYNVLTSIADGYPCRQCGMAMNETLGTISALETAYLLPAIDSRPRPEAPRLAAVPAAAAPAATPGPHPALSPDLLRRLVQVILIIGILGLLLYFLSKNP
ncbi:MAG TPA: hypothetical protein VKW04_19200 [Planctomycetota bacterium]|jgi:hypothetical protein|nr:hypothetical protein [Planctomycetota bacterium]